MLLRAFQVSRMHAHNMSLIRCGMPPVQALLDAGASIYGKTHMDELAYSLQGENVHYGTPINPAAPDRIPGGSSSGSVVGFASLCFLTFAACAGSQTLHRQGLLLQECCRAASSLPALRLHDGFSCLLLIKQQMLYLLFIQGNAKLVEACWPSMKQALSSSKSGDCTIDLAVSLQALCYSMGFSLAEMCCPRTVGMVWVNNKAAARSPQEPQYPGMC